MSKSAIKIKQKREPVHHTLFLSDQIQLTEISKPLIKKILKGIEAESIKQTSKPIEGYEEIVEKLDKLHIQEMEKDNEDTRES